MWHPFYIRVSRLGWYGGSPLSLVGRSPPQSQFGSILHFLKLNRKAPNVFEGKKNSIIPPSSHYTSKGLNESLLVPYLPLIWTIKFELNFPKTNLYFHYNPILESNIIYLEIHVYFRLQNSTNTPLDE